MRKKTIPLLMGVSLFLNVAYAADQAPNGFYYPTGTSKFSIGGDYMEKNYLGDGLWDHLSVDVIAPLNTEVLMIADGLISYISCSGWGTGNIGVVFRHYADDGKPFVSLSAHMQWEDFYGRFGKDASGKEQLQRDAKGGCLRQDVSGKNILVKAGKGVGRVGYYSGGNHVHETVWDTKDECSTIPPKHFGRVLITDHPNRDDPLCTVHPFQNSIHPATLIPKGEQGLHNVGDYVLKDSDRCDTATGWFKILDATKSNEWVTKEVSKDEACAGIPSAIEKTVQSARDHEGTVKVENLVGSEKATGWSSWISSVSSFFHTIWAEDIRIPTAIAADTSVQQQLAVSRTGQVYEIQGTNKQVVILTDGPGMNGDKAVDWKAYSEADPSETYAPPTGSNATGARPDFTATSLWTERSSGNQ